MLTSVEVVRDFRHDLVVWWGQHGRSYPWRDTDNVFHILLSEMMLQRTKADQVVPVYNSFIQQFPHPKSIMDASEDEIKIALFSLGLPQRASNIRKMAQQIVESFDGKVPATYKQLRELVGVGDYIASAVCCFGYNLPISIIDTNTVRIIGRLFGLATNPESRRKKHIRERHNFLLDPVNARSYNYGLLI